MLRDRDTGLPAGIAVAMALAISLSIICGSLLLHAVILSLATL